MADAWERGEPITAAEVLARHPEAEAESAIRLIFEEACLRRESGLDVRTSEVVRRHPRWGDELRALFACDRLLRPSALAAALPEVGASVGPFLLRAELGRGASGRTFLAADPTLADRTVVVKVIPADHEEHLALAPLRHTHIVPLFSEHTLPDLGLRILCMPDLGGASLAAILEELVPVPLSQRSGRRLVEILDRKSFGPPAEGPFRRGLERASYVEAVTWIAACLADALQYAHARGIVHMDLKPSNVLIAADGQPMLLDFHLARSPIAAGESVGGRIGGTPGWMSPEQEAAMAAVSGGRPVPSAVDGRSDLYALGLLLRDALMDPADVADRAGFRRPAGVGAALADLVRKCLAPDPRDRYPDAASLAADLRRHLDDLPLRGVRNRDPAERLRKWRRRHPGVVAWGITGLSMIGALAVVAGATLFIQNQRLDRVRLALEEGRRHLSAGDHDEAIEALERGLSEAGSLPGAGNLRDDLRHLVQQARREQVAGELHELADSVRARHAVDLPSDEEARSLLRLCRAVWDRRDRLAAEASDELRADLHELAAAQVDLVLRLAPPDVARHEALRLLDEAKASFGLSFALDLRRAELDGGTSEGAPAPEPRTAWEHYDLGRFLLRRGRVEAAEAEFRRAMEERPQDYWSNFHAGLCAYRLGRLDEAAAAFHTCVALQPGSAVGHYNRALALEALGRHDEALRDFSRALGLQPDLAAARLNRGIILYDLGEPARAADDFERGLAARPNLQTLGRLHYSLALARHALGERTPARRHAEEALKLGREEARRLLEELR